MVYHPHNPAGSSSYHSSSYDSDSVESKAAYFADKDDKGKHKKDDNSNQVYDAKDKPTDYNRNEENEEESKKNKKGSKPSVADKIKEHEEAGKENKGEELGNDSIAKKAAEEIHDEMGAIQSKNRAEKQKKANKSIEDAIMKAIKEEKEVIRLED